MRKKTFVAAAMTVVVCCMAGCGAQAERRTAADVAVRERTVRDLTVREEIEIQRAEERLVKQCMEAKGYPYWELPVPGVDERRAGRYVTDDVEWAKKYGYGRGFEERAEKIRRTDPTTVYQNKLRPKERAAYEKALDGDYRDRMSTELPGGAGTVDAPRGGCANEARSKLYGDSEEWFVTRKTVEGVLPLYGRDLMNDARFTKSVAKWARCMKEAGRPFDDLDQLRGNRAAVTEGMSSAEAHEFDAELAVLDATCAKKTSLARTMRTLETSYQEKVLERYEKERADYRGMRLNALAEAEDILS
ncbi:hypothetical protein OKJ48_23875 [Streptomyces kunmingensis]|uniref:Lipoprotein n=1 Tax=Streptomyces kunmingensis TaxID=68225 RepID=A0ABU6CFL6_9ACTN|nr:hypothetical protein [Streptomyces kunmingensis]MEB3963259.1 hypothetical protein [Streptomyces kunmingensis]